MNARKKAVKMRNTMTIQEIKDLIAAKIAGQGNQVDPGGALADVLTEILDKTGEGGGSGAALYELPVTLKLNDAVFEYTGEIDMEQLRNCSKITMSIPNPEMPEGDEIYIIWGFTRRNVVKFEPAGVDQETFLFGQYNGQTSNTEGVVLTFDNGELQSIGLGNAWFSPDDGGDIS